MFNCRSVFKLVIIFSLLIAQLNCLSQPGAEKGQPFIVNFNPKAFDFYPQNWSCVEDNRGIMYFGNIGYILQYDGASWRKITFPGSKQSTARAMIRDHEGRIFYSAVGDFGYLSPDSSGKMQCVSLLPYIPVSQRNFYDVWTIYETDNGIYFQSRDYIFRFTKTFLQGKENWRVKTWPASAKFMYAFYLDGTYYVHEQNAGLFKMIDDSLQIVPGSEFLGKDRMQMMLPYDEENGKHSYLVGLFYGGIYLYDGEHFKLFKTEADNIIKSALLYKGILLKNGTYALSTTGKGLIIINKNGKILQKINRDVGLQDESVYAVYEDAQNNIWLAMDNGISRIETSSPLTQFTIQSGVNSATLVVKRFNGILYLGTSNGLMKFDSNSRTFKEIPNFPQTQVFKLFQDNNNLLIPSDGIFTVNNKGLHLVRTTIGGDLQASCLLIAKKNPDILYAGTSLGVSVFKRNKNTDNEDWTLLGTIPKIEEQIWTLIEEDNGNIWAGTNGSNIYRFNLKLDNVGMPELKNTDIKTYDTANGLKFGSGPVYKIKNKLYFPDDSSINVFNEHDQRFYVDTTFGRFIGGASSQFCMTEDSSGSVWIRAGKTFRLATPQKNGSYKITDNTAFSPIADGTISAIYPEKDGTIWACATDGLIRYNASISKEYDQSFQTLIRNINAGSLLFNPLQDSVYNEQLISYKNNSIRFEYASPFYEQEQKTKYQTWLEGFDKTWSDWWFNDYKEYTNLSEGRYTFHVRALNVFNKISTEAVYHFQISAPWYRAWWAYLSYVIILAILISLFIGYRSRSLIRQNKMLEENVASRTEQLNKSVEDLKSTQAQLVQSEKMASLGELTAGIAHEIQNPLNFVNNFSEINKELVDELQIELKSGNVDEAIALSNDIKGNEEKINHHGKRADAIVKGMLQHSRTRSGGREQTDINKLADEYLRLAYHGLRAKDSSFNASMKTDFDESIGEINIIAQDVGRVFLNLFNNAFYSVGEKKKLQREGYEPTVFVTTKKIFDKIEIKVEDNGIGISQKIVDKVFQPFFTTKPAGEGTGLGLSLSYDIIKAHGGDITVNTKEKEFTAFIIQIPVR